MNPPVSLRLLGTPQATLDSQTVRGFESRKALALFCYLAVRDQPLDRTHLTDLFWGDKPQAKGRGNLSRVLHNLNEILPGVLAATRDTIQCKPDALQIDTREFEELTAQGTVEGLAAACALYTDEFMAGLFLDDCPEFEIWLEETRERWRQRIVSVLECIGGYYRRRADYKNALACAARLLEVEPWREEAHREMMGLLAQTGQRSAALHQYERARRVLAEELNVEPSAETQALYMQISSEEITLRPTARHNLPTQLTSFFGRETELTRISARLNNPDCRLLTLVGAGGIGKTRLALEAAKNLLTSFRDGVYFVSLAPIGVGQIEFVVPAIGSALEVTFAGSGEPKTQLLDFLREKQLLLLLDNFEHLLDGRSLVIELLQSAPNLKVMVTSREPLNVQAEWITRVTGLSYPTTPHNEELGRYSAVQLFAERASRVDEHFAMNAKTTPHVIHICRIVEGMPLAVELAAAALRTTRVKDVAEQLEHNLDLTTTMYDAEARHGSLRAVLDWSYALLSEPEQTLFRRLAVFAGGWMLEAAEAVCGGESVDAKMLRGVLDRLIDKSLVERYTQEPDTRYRLLEPIRQYAHSKLVEEDEELQVQRRHAEFYAEFAEQTEFRQYSPEYLVWYRRLDAERDNLRAAMEWGVQKKSIFAMRIVAALWNYWFVRSFSPEGLRWYRRVFAAKIDAPLVLRGYTLVAAANCAFVEGHSAETRHYASEALGIGRQCQDKTLLAGAMTYLGGLEWNERDAQKAASYFDQALPLARETKDPRVWGPLLLFSSQMLYDLREYDRAQLNYQEAVALGHELYAPFFIAAGMGELGRLALLRGDIEQARSYLTESLGVAREIGKQWRIAWSANLLSRVYMLDGDLAGAHALLTEALEIARELGSLAKLQIDLEAWARFALAQGKPQRAARLLAAFVAHLIRLDQTMRPIQQVLFDQTSALVQEQLDEATFHAEWAAGTKLNDEQVVALVSAQAGE